MSKQDYIPLALIERLADEAIAKQAGQNRTGKGKKKRATKEVIKALDKRIDWAKIAGSMGIPPILGFALDVVDAPLALLVAGVVESRFKKWKAKRGK